MYVQEAVPDTVEHRCTNVGMTIKTFFQCGRQLYIGIQRIHQPGCMRTGSIFRRKQLCQSNALVIPDVCAMFLCRILDSLCKVPAFKNHFRERIALFPEVSIRFIQFLAFQGSITLVIHIDHTNVHLVVDVVLLECLHGCKGAQVCADAHGTCATCADQILVHSFLFSLTARTAHKCRYQIQYDIHYGCNTIRFEQCVLDDVCIIHFIRRQDPH